MKVNELTIRPTIQHDWNKSYVIGFTLPFFAIGLDEEQDKRTLHDKKHKLRARYTLDSLNLQELRPILGYPEDCLLQGKLVLHEGVCSFSTTGVTEEHWTTYCFDDDFFETEPRLLEEGEELERSDGCVDPIIIAVEVKDTATQWRPRQYSLVALATQLERILGHHTRINDVFKQSFDSYVCAPNSKTTCFVTRSFKEGEIASIRLTLSQTPSTRDDPSRNLNPSNKQDWKRFPQHLDKVIFYTTKIIEEVERFLAENVQLSSAGVPEGVLWQSLRNDERALEALCAIKEIVRELKRARDRLMETKKSFEELRREVSSSSQLSKN